jgi:hypothetical protein
MPIAIIENPPGIQRDGTSLDAKLFSDGQWVRFQRGRPKKMGGYQRITRKVNGPVYGTHVWNRQGTNLVTLFSGSGIEQIQVNNSFIGASISDRTPANWVSDKSIVWQFGTLYDSAANSNKTLLLAHAGHNLNSIDEGVASDIYYGDVGDTSTMVALGPEWRVSGGLVAAAPYLIAYGSDGKVIWSNQNEPRNASTGDAGTARITDKKIIKGLQIRNAGKSPSVLLWSIDSVMRMSYIGGPAVFYFETVSSESSVLSSSGIVDYDGNFYWAGVDRFMMYDGKVGELPNTTNVNYFYDNLNFEQRQKVFAIKVPRFGEIWWFYPVGSDLECSKAVIFNVREKIWYDVSLSRTSGSSSRTTRNPMLTGAEQLSKTKRITFTAPTGNFLIGETITGSFTGTTGKVEKITGDKLYLSNVSGLFRDSPAENIAGPSGSATIGVLDDTRQYALWLHEAGLNKIAGDDEMAIKSFIETTDFSYLTGGPATVGGQAVNAQTRLTRIEPDFILSGTMKINVVGERFANSDTYVSKDYEITQSTEYLDMREQVRIIRLRFTSDCLNGNYEMGRAIMTLEQGDEKV